MTVGSAFDGESAEVFIRRSLMISLGCDIGAIATKAVILRDGAVAAYDIRANNGRMTEAAEQSVQNALLKGGISLDDVRYCGGTGWGERYLPFSHTTESMISSLARGVHWLVPGARTIVNIGGLSSAIININAKKGQVIEYRTNDRCASGTGFFLEMAAQALELKVEDLGAIALSAKGRAHIGAQCAVFGESEIVTHLNEGVDPADIAAGITYSVGASLASMANRLRVEREIVVTGGVAKNSAVIKSFEEKAGVETTKFALDPQLVAAVGAALLAMEKSRIRNEV